MNEEQQIETGGPAFPCDFNSVGYGISTRDYFAAKAMQGDIASMVDPSGERCGIAIDLADENLNRLASLYYRMADAMLKARNQ